MAFPLKALHPADRRTDANRKPPRRLMSRHPADHGLNNPKPKILRV
jgi:hypothetical protein